MQEQGYITSAYLTDNKYVTSDDVANYLTGKNYITSDTLTDYATQAWVEDKGYLTSIPSSYATKSYVNNYVTEQGFVTASELTTGVSTKSLYITTDGKITIPSGATLSLFGYTPKWNQMTVVKSLEVQTANAYVMTADGGTQKITYIKSWSQTNDTITYLYRGS